MADQQLVDVLMTAVKSALSDMHTATIAKVTKVSEKTINCRPVINRVVDGEPVELPEFVDVPPLFLQGGGSYTAHPVAVGDYCLLVFTERCFDRWYDGQDFQIPAELRMHDYSDGIAIVGINPLAAALTIPTVIQQTGDTNQDGDYTHQGNMTRTGDTTLDGSVTQTGDYDQTGNQTITGDLTVDGNVTVTGNLTVAGNVAAGSFSGPAGGAMTAQGDIQTAGTVAAGTDVTGGGVSLKSHTHTGDSGGTTSPPN